MRLTRLFEFAILALGFGFLVAFSLDLPFGSVLSALACLFVGYAMAGYLVGKEVSNE